MTPPALRSRAALHGPPSPLLLAAVGRFCTARRHRSLPTVIFCEIKTRTGGHSGLEGAWRRVLVAGPGRCFAVSIFP